MAKTPAWVPDAVFYALNPDRFARGSPPSPPPWDTTVFEEWDAPPAHKAYKGGTLYGVLEHLDSLQDLGVNALYLTPIFTSPTHHRYKPTRHFEVDPLLGGNEAFDRLLAELKHRGMRVILDGVFNHVGLGFSPFQDVLEYGTASPWRSWFHMEKWPQYECWNNNRTMPRLNHANRAVQDYIFSVAEFWVRKGIDGWRFDAPQEINVPGFWQEMRRRLKAIDPEIYLMGEIWTDAKAWLDGTQWDGATNYPLLGAIQRFVCGDRIRKEHLLDAGRDFQPLDAGGFRREVEEMMDRCPSEIRQCMFNFLSTHDIARFLTVCGGDLRLFELATVILMAFPGTPCIYYGDEVGMEGGLPPASRGGFPAPDRWNSHCLRFHRTLIALRHKHPALRDGRLRFLQAEETLLVFERSNDTERLLVVINTGSTEATLAAPDGRQIYGSACASCGGLSLDPHSSAIFLCSS